MWKQTIITIIRRISYENQLIISIIHSTISTINQIVAPISPDYYQNKASFMRHSLDYDFNCFIHSIIQRIHRLMPDDSLEYYNNQSTWTPNPRSIHMHITLHYRPTWKENLHNNIWLGRIDDYTAQLESINFVTRIRPKLVFIIGWVFYKSTRFLVANRVHFTKQTLQKK